VAVALGGAAVGGVAVTAAQARSTGRAVAPRADTVSDWAHATVSCSFQQVGRRVALTPGAASVAARGSWHHGNCPVTWAKVRVQLQAEHNGTWQDIGPAATSTARRGGSAVATFACYNAKQTKWRSVVDVDIVDQSDDPTKLTTPARLLGCCPTPAVLKD
jgi:hypothetical protein